MRLRTKFSILLTVCGLLSVASTAYLLTRNFTADQEAYLNDFQATLALSISRQLSARLDLLHAQLAAFPKEAPFPLADVVAKVDGVVAGEVWDDKKRVANAGPGNEAMEVSPPSGNTAWSLMKSPSQRYTALRWLGRFGSRTLVLDLSARWLGGLLETTHGAELRIFGSDGHLIANHQGTPSANEANTLFESRATFQRLSRLKPGVPHTKQYLGIDGARYVGTFLLVESEPPFFVTVRTPASQISQVIQRTLLLSAGIAGSCLIVSLLLGFVFSEQFTAPIQMLAEHNLEVSKGRLESFVPIGESRGDEIGTLVRSFNTMIRELRRAREELRRSERLATFGTFGAAVAHEIKNPLAGIVATAQVAARQIETGKSDPDTLRQLLGCISDEATRAARTITKLMTFARKDKPPEEKVDLRELVSRSIELMRHDIETQGATLIANLPASTLYCMANSDEIHEVLLNIVQNGLHAMRETSTKKLEVTLTARNSSAVITLRDTGHGLSKEAQEHLFEPFFTTKKIGEGTGLGLPVCHGIVANHNGKIEVASEEGKGTTFSIYLPLTERTPQELSRGTLAA